MNQASETNKIEASKNGELAFISLNHSDAEKQLHRIGQRDHIKTYYLKGKLHPIFENLRNLTS